MPTIDITATPGNTSDDGQFTLTLSEASLGPVTVQFRVFGQTAQTGTHISDATGVVTIPAGDLSATLERNHFGSSTADLNYTVEFTDPVGGEFADGSQLVRVDNVILYSERAFFVSDPVVIEDENGPATAVFEIRLSRESTAPLVFDFSTVDGTAVAGEDFTQTSGTLSFAPGETVKTVEVPILADSVAEFNEAFSLVVEPQLSTGAALSNDAGDASGIAIIRDNDDASVLPSISVEFAEGNTSGDGQFAIRLSEPVLGDVTVQFRIFGQTALTGSDITEEIGTRTIPAGETSITLDLNHFGSGSFDDVYTLELTDPTGAVLEGDQQLLRATGVILRGDRSVSVSDPVVDEEAGEAVFEIRLTRPSEVPLTFDVTTQDGTGEAGEDYQPVTTSVVFLPGQTLAAVRVPLLDDSDAEQSETFSLVVNPQTASAAAITQSTGDGTGIAIIRDGDTGGTLPTLTVEPAEGNTSGEGQFVVRLSEASLGDVTVTAQIIGQQARTGTDISDDIFSVTIPAGETSVTVNRNHFGSGTADDNYILELTDPVGAVFPDNVTVLRETGVILRSALSLFVSDPVIYETDGTTEAVFEIRLSRPSDQPLTFDFETRDGSALAGEDYETVTGTVTFLPGQTISSVKVPVLGDAVIEGSEFFTLGVSPQLSSAPAVQNGFFESEGVALIHDSQSATNLPVLSVEAAEGNTSGDGQFILRLDRPSLGPVTVEFRVIGDTARASNDVTDGSGTLTIPAGQTSIILDRNHAGSGSFDENYIVEFTDPSGAVLAGDAAVLRTTGVILRGERALFVDDPVVYEDDENGAFAVFEIRLSIPSDNPLTFDFTTIDGTALAGEDYEAVSGSILFDSGQTLAAVKVPLIGDRFGEGTETFSLIVTPDVTSASAISSGAADAGGVATILDEDTAEGLPVLSIEFAEGTDSGDGQFAVRLSEPSAQNVTFELRTISDTASAGSDVTGFESTLITIPAGQQSIFIDVNHFSSSTGSVDAGYLLELTNPGGAVFADDALALTVRGIVLEGGLGLFVSDATVAEGDSVGENSAAFEVRLSRPSDNPLSFTFTTADGSAVAGTDYEATSGSLTFLPGQTLAVIQVPILGDTAVEVDLDFTLTLTPTITTAPAILNGAASASGRGVIVDDDIADQIGVNTSADLLISGFDNGDLSGLGGDDVIEGRGGNDTLSGDNGNDSLFGGTGEDLLFGGAGADLIDGGGSVDTVSYVKGTGAVRVFLDRGFAAGNTGQGDMLVSIENAVGSAFDDRIVGDNLANTLDGGAGGDFLNGISGDDLLLGSGGNDDLRGGFGFDVLDGGSNNDTLFGGNDEDELYGGNGNDFINGNNDTDTVFGGNGQDDISGGGGEDEVFGGVGNDTVAGGARDDRIFGGTGNDTVNGGLGNDVIIAGAGNDNLSGGIGQDFLRGGEGDDSMGGGNGGDRFFFAEDNFGDDVIRDFQNADVIDLSRLGVAFDDLTIQSVGGGSSTLITLDQGSIRLNGVDAATVNADDFDFIL